MKTKTLGLLALSAVALAMPFTASAAVTSITYVTDGASMPVGSPITGGQNVTVTPALGDQWSVNANFNGLPTATSGSPNVETVSFKVSGGPPPVNDFAGSANATFRINSTGAVTKISLYDTTTSTSLGSLAGTQYNATGLNSTDTYQWSISSWSNKAPYTLNTSFTVAVPEPEEWAMMLVGAGLVSYQVRRKQKGLGKSVLAA